MSAVCEKRVVLIGSGDRAGAWVEALRTSSEFALVALVDPEPSEARRVVGSARPHTRSGELITRGRAPDIALICAPTSLHSDFAQRLLRGGSDLLIEPPLATTRGDAEQLTELAERLGRSLYCRSGLVAAIRAAGLHLLVERGSLGQLQRVEIRLSHKRDARSGWRADPALSGGGALMDLGPHALELAELVAGPLDQIRMLECGHLQRAEVEDTVVLETNHRTGAIGRIELDWNEAEQSPLARCHGQRGELVIGRLSSGLRSGDQDLRVEVTLDEPHRDAAALAELMALRLERDPICDEGARTLGWLHAAYRSHELGRWQYA